MSQVVVNSSVNEFEILLADNIYIYIYIYMCVCVYSYT